MRFRVWGLMLGVCAAAAAPASAVVVANADTSDVQARTVCFVAHNGDDPVAVDVTGTIFTPRHYSASTPVVLGVHGFGGDRTVFDGWFFGPTRAGSFARLLAASGYVVVTYDQIGFGQSPYVRPAGSGFSITMDNELGALHEVVTQVRAGAFRVDATGACPGGAGAPFGFRHVVLLGHSAGGLLTDTYAGRYHDIDALISVANTFVADDDLTEDVLNPWLIPQLQAGNDYPTFMPPNPSGLVSTQCLEFFFYRPAGHSPLLDAACANRRLESVPGGNLISVGDITTEEQAGVASVGHIPVLMVFADRDRIFVGPKLASAKRPDTVTPFIAYWRTHCGCTVTVHTQPNTGHYLFLQGTMPSTADFVEDWLDRSL